MESALCAYMRACRVRARVHACVCVSEPVDGLGDCGAATHQLQTGESTHWMEEKKDNLNPQIECRHKWHDGRPVVLEVLRSGRCPRDPWLDEIGHGEAHESCQKTIPIEKETSV